MNDLGYIATGFLITFVTVVGYLLSLRARLSQAERAHVRHVAGADEGSR